MTKRSEYEQIWFGEWMDINNGIRLACCDCGLVHELSYRLHDGKVQIKMSALPHETRKLRRYYKHEFKKA